jgi:ABC-type Mn2+/Zn2+ transport system permease subunit
MAALLGTASIRATFVTAAASSMVLPSVGLALSFYLDLPAGPASVALLVVSVPLAAMRHLPTQGNRTRLHEKPKVEH